MEFFKQFTKYHYPNAGLVRLPEVKIDNKTKSRLGLGSNATNFDLLKALVWEGFEKKKGEFQKAKIEQYVEQINFELSIVEELSFTDYFLLVWMVIAKAIEMGAFIDYGRGSCAASLCFYLMGVTGVDPIEKKLIFERFISKVRAKKTVIDGVTYLVGDLAPDVDLNLGGVRKEIVEWLKELYPGKVCKIVALSTLTGKALIKDVIKTVDEAGEVDAKKVADLVERHAGIVDDIEAIYETSKPFKEWADANIKTYQIALKLRNLIRQKTSHASGYVIAFEELDGFIPMELNKDKELTASYEMDDVANFAIKLDLLGLINNVIIKDVLQNIPETIEEINKKLDDNDIIYDQFQHGKLAPYGLYQICGDCAYGATNAIKPKNIFELSDVSAIARPGALAGLSGYVEGDNPCPHPVFKDILSWTRNLCLYQEQMMQMAVAIGFTKDDAELLRRVVGKKKVNEVKEWKERIYTTAEKNGLPREIGDILWKILDDSSKYSFNLAHSIATSYLSALTVYLKYKYPLQFYTGCLKAAKELGDPTGEISLIQQELKQFGIKLLPPHIIKSDLDFKIEGNNIRFGLGQIKGIGAKTIEKLNNFKSDFSDKFQIFQAANEAKINVSVLSSLILVGALDDEISKQPRSRVVLEAQLWNLLTGKGEKDVVKQYAKQFNYDLLEIMRYITKNHRDAKGKLFFKDRRLETIRNKYKDYQKMYSYNSKNEEFAKYYFENRLLGFPYSLHLVDIYREFSDDFIQIEEIKERPMNNKVHFVGTVAEVKEWVAKNEKKTRTLKAYIKDETGTIPVMLFNENIEEHRERNGRKLVEGDIVCIDGNKKEDAVFAWKIGIQDTTVFQTLSEMLKNEKTKNNDNKFVDSEPEFIYTNENE